MKIYDKYRILKEQNSIKKYLFRAGNFYIFISDDAIEVSKYTTLKVTNFGEIVKCGFPVNSLDKYLNIFNNIGLEIEIIERYKDIIIDISRENLDSLSKLELISIIERFINAI